MARTREGGALSGVIRGCGRVCEVMIDPIRHRPRRLAALLTAAGLLLLPGVVTRSSGGPLPESLEQGWTSAEREAFYRGTQGARMLPLSWLRALDRVDSDARFLADGLVRYGYLRSPTPAAADLPVGFAIDRGARHDWVGISCAACHSGEVRYRGRRVYVDGGPAGASLWPLLSELYAALEATAADRRSPRFRRFARAVLGPDGRGGDDDRLFADLTRTVEEWGEFLLPGAPTVAWGPGRADGFGFIFNRLAGGLLNRPENIEPLDAPVSYPQLWGTSWHDRVQWNGSAPNRSDFERLARNTGQLLGNFAHVVLRRPDPNAPYYPSSVDPDRLRAIEDAIKRLRPPAWPGDLLGPIDATRAREGGRLYEHHCASCHAVLPADRYDTPIEVVLTPVAAVGTDPAMAEDYCNRWFDPGRLEGVAVSPIAGGPLPDPVRARSFLNHVIIGAILVPDLRAEPGRAVGSTPPAMPAALEPCGPDDPLMAYKARPLHGIWATAPFLHNGSVPTLYDLLLPPRERPGRFWVGSRELDPYRVGFESRRGPGAFLFDTAARGNSRLGHDYATERLTEQQRWALVEYLKSL